ncbi:hydroxymethylbilane synthase [Propylenella binzhouense]|uniref:Porphobilinogen deaminase n=1 Tax=Propylenella binzhouense TaxID=2555902 RepID=A0A964WVQ8_9HYPH|nr:hydroxymethylbilane synthase [Propylenella binzhouense]MYZ50497.1 hydroxymethylbilane synthase [Propylenella binzhouense]
MRIGTRGSRLALWQAETVRARLAAREGLPEGAYEIVVIRTSGDRIQDRALLEAGGKGLFTKEIEEALLGSEIDIAVHSAKDMPTALPDGLALAAYLEREDVRDAFISASAPSLEALKPGAVVGTASLRREAQLKRVRPDLRVELLRGNVPTRLKRVEDGEFDATLLACAGLKRLGLEAHVTALLPVDRFLPACGQGAVVVEARADDEATLERLDLVAHRDTARAVACERAFLAVLDGSCRTPIAGYAEIEGERLRFRGIVLARDGGEFYTVEQSGPAVAAADIGEEAGFALRRMAPDGFLAALGIA